MPKKNYSWSKLEGIDNLIARKKVDFSIFNYGVHIPNEYSHDFLEVIPGQKIDQGKSEEVTLEFDDRAFQVRIMNINRKGYDGDTIQMRYDSNKELINYLKEQFKTSIEYIETHYDGNGKNNKVEVPDELAEYIEFYKTDKMFYYKVKLITNNEVDTMDNRKNFTKWLETCAKISSSSIKKYTSAINTISQELMEQNMLSSNLYNISNVKEVKKYIEQYFSIEKFKEKDERGNRMYSSALAYYVKFLESDDFITSENEEISLKEKFFKYVGSRDSLNGYQKSYKLYLLLQLLNLSDKEGKADYDEVCENICKMYIVRHEAGLSAETEDTEIQKKIQSLNKHIVKAEMTKNPYHFIHEKGHIHIKHIDEIEYLSFDEALWKELNEEDKDNLRDILKDKLKLYYTERVDNQQNTHQEEPLMEVETTYTPIEYIEHIYNYINAQGFTYSIDTIKNFYLSLKTKPFVLLAGISGTGKSKLIELFAGAVGATSENYRFTIIPVRPDWSDPSDLLGYKNINGKFQPGPLTNIIKRAVNDLGRPYFVCLDEMNLARVEYYFSDILSLMETRKRRDRIRTDRLLKDEIFGDDEEAREKFSNLYIPENLYIIGTVNMDETTFPFSKKVLDRANTIEFNQVDLSMGIDLMELEDVESIGMMNKILCSKYLKLKDCLENRERMKDVADILEKINKILEEVGLHFGYRVRDEVIFYILYATDEKLMEFEKAVDYTIIQKILPRIQGSNLRIKETLIKLYQYLSNDKSKEYDVYKQDNWEKMNKYLNEMKVKYPLSAKKAARMLRRYEVDGFTTFWE